MIHHSDHTDKISSEQLNESVKICVCQMKACCKMDFYVMSISLWMTLDIGHSSDIARKLSYFLTCQSVSQ